MFKSYFQLFRYISMYRCTYILAWYGIVDALKMEKVGNLEQATQLVSICGSKQTCSCWGGSLALVHIVQVTGFAAQLFALRAILSAATILQNPAWNH